MRYCLSAVFFCLAGLLFVAGAASPNDHPEPNALFSPHGGCTAGVEAVLDDAANSAYVASYVLSSDRIASALIRAKRRGVNVQIIMDDTGAAMNGSDRDKLITAGIPVYLDSKHRIMHNKVMVIDGEKIITGSFNWTDAAENNNAENLLILTSKSLAAKYLDNWRHHHAHSARAILEQSQTTTSPISDNPEKPNTCANGKCGTTPPFARPRRR